MLAVTYIDILFSRYSKISVSFCGTFFTTLIINIFKDLYIRRFQFIPGYAEYHSIWYQKYRSLPFTLLITFLTKFDYNHFDNMIEKFDTQKLDIQKTKQHKRNLDLNESGEENHFQLHFTFKCQALEMQFCIHHQHHRHHYAHSQYPLAFNILFWYSTIYFWPPVVTGTALYLSSIWYGAFGSTFTPAIVSWPCCSSFPINNGRWHLEWFTKGHNSNAKTLTLKSIQQISNEWNQMRRDETIDGQKKECQHGWTNIQTVSQTNGYEWLAWEGNW